MFVNSSFVGLHIPILTVDWRSPDGTSGRPAIFANMVIRLLFDLSHYVEEAKVYQSHHMAENKVLTKRRARWR